MDGYAAMRLRHVSVKGLFGIFDHEIPLHLEERITIIHGLNGYGKTIILQMIEEALTGKLGVLATVPYTSLELTFDDDACLQITGTGATISDEGTGRELRVTFTKPGCAPERSRFPLETPPYMSPRSQSQDERTRASSEGAFRTWIATLGCEIPVLLVQTQRLLAPKWNNEIEPTVEALSEWLRRAIQAVVEQYAAHAQELDRTFPSRLLAQVPPASLSFEDFQRQLVELEARRSQLTALGLLDPEQDIGPITRTDDPTKLGALAIYIQDMKAKLAVFDELAERISALKSIVNERFRYKALSIDRKRGLVFTTPDRGPLPVSALSSGEQHELVLLVTLLFRVEQDGLVLIDEPEISLHLIWQQQFLPDLMRIVALSGFDVLIATHSADIIGEHWDLTVQLQGPAT